MYKNKIDTSHLPANRQPNVQFVILHRNGTRTYEWRYCSCFARARQLARSLQLTYNAQKVWF